VRGQRLTIHLSRCGCENMQNLCLQPSTSIKERCAASRARTPNRYSHLFGTGVLRDCEAGAGNRRGERLGVVCHRLWQTTEFVNLRLPVAKVKRYICGNVSGSSPVNLPPHSTPIFATPTPFYLVRPKFARPVLLGNQSLARHSERSDFSSRIDKNQELLIALSRVSTTFAECWSVAE